jgi:hypothetical protein
MRCFVAFAVVNVGARATTEWALGSLTYYDWLTMQHSVVCFILPLVARTVERSLIKLPPAV